MWNPFKKRMVEVTVEAEFGGKPIAGAVAKLFKRGEVLPKDGLLLPNKFIRPLKDWRAGEVMLLVEAPGAAPWGPARVELAKGQRAVVVKATMGPLPQAQEKQPEPEKPKGPPRVDKIRVMASAGKGEVRATLALMPESKDPITSEEMGVLNALFRTAQNKSPCPCGSGVAYRECCKTDWQELQKEYSRRRSQEMEEKAGDKNEKADGVLDKTKWYCRVGVAKQGHPVVAPLEGGEKFPMEAVSEVLDAANRSFRDELLLRHVMEVVQGAVPRMVGDALLEASKRRAEKAVGGRPADDKPKVILTGVPNPR